ncbi:MAG: MgtC/SapB family protein [Candidatus Omnitrophica bacterium]|nr:hypothetical protein [bacterium]NUN94786.1 MgtC/SapB family protein [Candidatus Omnitrophota bacterium]
MQGWPQLLDSTQWQYLEIGLHEAAKMFLAAFLGVLLSFRRKPDRYRLNLIEAHALLAMAGAMFMVIISGEIIRAVALLGAASIVRYRYAITSARDASTLILSLGVGMGCGSNLMIQVTAGTILILIVDRLLAFFPEVLPFSMVSRREHMRLTLNCDDYDTAMSRVQAVLLANDVRHMVVSYDLKFRKGADQEVSEVSFEVSVSGDADLHAISKQIFGPGVTRVAWQSSQPAQR